LLKLKKNRRCWNSIVAPKRFCDFKVNGVGTLVAVSHVHPKLGRDLGHQCRYAFKENCPTVVWVFDGNHGLVDCLTE